MTDYQQQAIDFLKEADTEIKIEYEASVDGFPFDKKDTLPHNKYIVTLSRKGKTYEFPFYGSYADYRDDKDPNEYTVLACLEKYDPGTMADFVGEFGYVIVDRESFLRVEKIWLAVKEQVRKLKELFGEELMDKLCEIS